MGSEWKNDEPDIINYGQRKNLFGLTMTYYYHSNIISDDDEQCTHLLSLMMMNNAHKNTDLGSVPVAYLAQKRFHVRPATLGIHLSAL